MRFIQIVFIIYLERSVMIYVVENNKRLRIIFTESFYYGDEDITSYFVASWYYTDTSPPYVLSLSLPISFGMLTMLANFVFVLIEIIVLGKDFPKEQYLQLIVGPILGLSIDFWSYFILYIPQPFYIIQLL